MSALAGLMFGVAVISIGLYHVAVVDPRLRSIRKTLSNGGRSGSASDVGALGARCTARFAEIEQTIARDVHRVGFVRYNAFDDVGSDQSFTLALVNGAGNGVLVTSIFSRTETRTFGKAVRGYVPEHGASKEEESALAMARAGS